MKYNYRTRVGDLVIIKIAGVRKLKFIAKVVGYNPLEVIIQEEGKYANYLREREWQLLEEETSLFQNLETRYPLLADHKAEGSPIVYALKCLGIKGDNFYEAVPPDKPKSVN